MDIQVSSNFERYLFEIYDRDAEQVRALMQRFREDRAFSVGGDRFARTRETFIASRCDDERTQQVIRAVWKESGVMVDPHTAIGIAAARDARAATLPADVPVIAVATAHPAKFPEAVEAATGIRPALPARLANLLEGQENYQVLPADAGRLRMEITEIMEAKGVNA